MAVVEELWPLVGSESVSFRDANVIAQAPLLYGVLAVVNNFPFSLLAGEG